MRQAGEPIPQGPPAAPGAVFPRAGEEAPNFRSGSPKGTPTILSPHRSHSPFPSGQAATYTKSYNKKSAAKSVLQGQPPCAMPNPMSRPSYTESVPTLAQWEAAKAVLTAEDPSGFVSPQAAARVAGIPLPVLRAWIKRSREQRVEDEPWVHEIAEVYDTRYQAQAAVLEDVLLDHAINGQRTPVYVNGEQVGERITYDHWLGLRLLEVRDPRYQQGATRTTPPQAPPTRRPLLTRLLAEAKQELVKQHEAWVKQQWANPPRNAQRRTTQPDESLTARTNTTGQKHP